MAVPNLNHLTGHDPRYIRRQDLILTVCLSRSETDRMPSANVICTKNQCFVVSCWSFPTPSERAVPWSCQTHCGVCDARSSRSPARSTGRCNTRMYP